MTIFRVAKSGVGWEWWWGSTPAGAEAGTGAGTAAVAGVRAAGCTRAAGQDGTGAGERAGGRSAGSARKRDHCTEDHKNHHRHNRCYGRRAAGGQEPGTTVAGTAAVVGIRRWARAVVVLAGPEASDRRMPGNCNKNNAY